MRRCRRAITAMLLKKIAEKQRGRVLEPLCKGPLPEAGPVAGGSQSRPLAADRPCFAAPDLATLSVRPLGGKRRAPTVACC